MDEKYISIKNLRKEFYSGSGLFSKSNVLLKAVNGVSFDINKGTTLGLVGESGCGKSTLGRCLLRLIEPDAGQILYKGTDILKFNFDEMKKFRKRFQIIFQDPYSSLNPRMTVGDTLREIIKFHTSAGYNGTEKRCRDLLSVTGMPASSINKYPHEFSGGQRQRIAIARALAVEPEFIVCDEPVSALDVSIQSQIINLLKELQSEFGLTYLFISHDLSVVRHISDDVAVMYLGSIVEYSSKNNLFDSPYHPYTKSLLKAVPGTEPGAGTRREAPEGEIPNPANLPAGCPFSTRCPDVLDECILNYPGRHGTDGHYVFCHLYENKYTIKV